MGKANVKNAMIMITIICNKTSLNVSYLSRNLVVSFLLCNVAFQNVKKKQPNFLSDLLCPILIFFLSPIHLISNKLGSKNKYPDS